jgi:hypothetical protein
MPRSRPVYSEAHDESINPSAGRRRRGRGRAPVQASAPRPLPPFPTTGAGFLPPNLTDEQRVDIRARQLLADRQARGIPVPPGQLPPDKLTPLPDHDLYQDMDVPDPRGYQHNQFAGPVNTIFPEVRGPQPTHTKVRVLPDYAEHPPLPDFDDPSRVNASENVIAAVSASDQTILAFDNAMTTVHTALRDLRQKSERMAQAVSRQDDNPGVENSPTSHAHNIVRLLAAIIEPWFNILDDEFGQLLNGTQQGEAVEEASPGVAGSRDIEDERE